MPATISNNDLVILADDRGNKILLTVSKGPARVKGMGVYDSSQLQGMRPGETISIAGRDFVILIPSISERISAIDRKAQVVLPKDGVFIIHHCDIKSGDTILEAGSGSGALTILLAQAVQPGGRVISYEIREDFARIARRNVRKVGLDKFVDFVKGDVTAGIEETDVDAVVFDIPNPWDALGQGFGALKTGGYLACYSPTTNQVERTVRGMRTRGLAFIRTVETLQRDINVGEMGIRPSFDMLGHTGYVTFGRKISL